jgi:hypothetical protein
MATSIDTRNGGALDPPVRKNPDLESALELLRRYNRVNLELNRAGFSGGWFT